MKRVLFVTGTRADFGKLKPLIHKLDARSDQFEVLVFATGMHTLQLYGYTVHEVQKEGFNNIHVYMNQILNEPMDLVLANTIFGLSRYVHEVVPDMIVVHGDRVEAAAGAIVGALKNILVSHVEGGELSGTIDESIRHATSKLSHIHFVANERSKLRLEQMGEQTDSIWVIGSPDIDVMTRMDLPGLNETKRYYEIPFEQYAVAIFHPVTTELHSLKSQVRNFVDALLESQENFVVVYPNNDEGSETILSEYQRLIDQPNIAIFPSIRFEYFLVLLKNANFIVGNSSAGIREAPFYGIPTVNIGSRQNGRTTSSNIHHCEARTDEILKCIEKAAKQTHLAPVSEFGDGNSAQRFLEVILQKDIWKLATQKRFKDLPLDQIVQGL